MSAWNFQDLTGQKFGKLLVIKRAEDYISPSGNRTPCWLCVCDCGNQKIVASASLKKGTQSCGCIQRERAKQTHTKHGKRETRLYRIWQGIVTRCTNSNHHTFKNYGGRGITVCDEWLKDFQVFYTWAMANGYTDELSIDRVDNDRGYYPDNCKWVGTVSQNNNKRSNHYISYNEKTLTLAQWSKVLDIPYSKLVNRINKLNWSPEKAFSKK